MTERQGVEIDYCPKCRGVWLDRGELDKIIDRVTMADSSSMAPRSSGRERESRNDYDRDHDDYKRKRKKGLLGELFDF
jgi:Zn-finger nucleic acid-binding protein